MSCDLYALSMFVNTEDGERVYQVDGLVWKVLWRVWAHEGWLSLAWICRDVQLCNVSQPHLLEELSIIHNYYLIVWSLWTTLHLGPSWTTSWSSSLPTLLMAQRSCPHMSSVLSTSGLHQEIYQVSSLGLGLVALLHITGVYVCLSRHWDDTSRWGAVTSEGAGVLDWEARHLLPPRDWQKQTGEILSPAETPRGG